MRRCRCGLAEVLRRLATRFERETGVRVRVHVQADAPREVQVVLLRAAQEGLANVHKHSAAGAVTIAVDDDGGAIVLTVDDDGRGPIGYVDDTECGFGILGMRERVALVGGTVDLGFRDGGGARLRVRVRVPLDPPAEVTT